MNAKRKSTLGTRPRPNIVAPRRLTTILNLIPDIETDDESRNRNAPQLNSKHKQSRSNKVPTQTTSNKGNAKRPVNTMIYKRTALKPANSTAVHKESTPRQESLKGQMAKSTLLKSSEGTGALTGGLRMMRERTARARAARILSTPNNSNIVRKGEIPVNRTPLHIPLAQLTPQNLIFTKHNSDFPCSLDRNNVAKRQCKSTAFELLSCDTVSLQSKKIIFADENRMEHTRTNVTESHFGNENQENLAQEYHKPGLTSYNLIADELQKENTTNGYPSIQISSPFKNLKPSILQTEMSQNFTSAYNNNMGLSQIKPITPELNHIVPLPSGHLKTAISSKNISSAVMQPSVKSQVSEPKPSNISCLCSNTENIHDVPFGTNSALQRKNYEEINKCSRKDDKDDKEKDEAEAVTLKEGTESIRGAWSLKKPHVKEIVKNLLNLQEQCKTEMEHFMEKMKDIQNQQSEMLQKLLTVYQTTEEKDECKQSTSVTKESKANFSTDMSMEMECAESEKLLGLIVSEKKKRRSSRIAAKMNSDASTPDPCDMHTAVVAKYKDLQKSFTFLRTPRSCKTPLEGKILTRTPRTIVSTSIRAQLQLLYDTDSPQ